jgi:hypothetical protein
MEEGEASKASPRASSWQRALDPPRQCAILEEVKKKVRDQFAFGGGSF